MDAIKSYILRHGLHPGDRLPTESALCADLGVSRSSVREALRRLQALDIVTVRQGSGSYVGEMSMQPLVETLVLRAALDEIARDPEIAEIVAGVIKASDQVLSPVRRSLATQSVASLPFELPATPESAAVTRDVAGPDEAALSVPGIVAAQLGALIDLTRAGLNIVANQPAAFEGHSQGVLGVEIARAWIAGDEARAASCGWAAVTHT